MKRTVYNRSLSYKPGVFIPRRDLFPEEGKPLPKLQPVPGGTASAGPKPIFPKLFDKEAGSSGKASHRRAPKAHTPDHVILILLLFGGLLLWPRLKLGSMEAEPDIQSAVSDLVENPVGLKILHAVCPYLDERERDVVFTITGIAEVLRTIEELLDRRYHMRQQSKLMAVPVDPVSRRIGIVKALKPYIPEVGKRTVDNVLKVYDTFNELSRNIEKYRSSGASLSDAAEVIIPLLPDEFRRRAGRIVKVLKVAEAMDLAEDLHDARPGKPEIEEKLEITEKSEVETNTGYRDGKSQKQAENTVKVEKMVEALKPMLSDEQKGSTEVLMKMARLLSGPDGENKDNEESNTEQ